MDMFREAMPSYMPYSEDEVFSFTQVSDTIMDISVETRMDSPRSRRHIDRFSRSDNSPKMLPPKTLNFSFDDSDDDCLPAPRLPHATIALTKGSSPINRMLSFDLADSDDEPETARLNDFTKLDDSFTISPRTNSQSNVIRRPQRVGIRRQLIKESTPFTINRRDFSRKRKEPANVETENKRRKLGDSISNTSHCEWNSMETDDNDLKVKRALNRCLTEDNLSGDLTQACTLPCVSGKHRDVKYITCNTMCRLLNNEYKNVEDYTIIDCRYPYEYEGGHIEGGINLFTIKDISCEFLSKVKQVRNAEKRLVLIFHCEFSSERGPKLARFLRNKDREVNRENYPNLHYPEIYVLKDGYKNFYEQHVESCVPQSYKPMLHADHADDLKLYRAKAKSSEKQSRRPASSHSLRFQ